MAIALLENFKGLGLDPALDIKAQTVAPYGAVPGIWVVLTNGTNWAGKADIVGLHILNGKTWITRFNSGNAYFGPSLEGIPAIPTGTSTITLGTRFRFTTPGAAVTLALFRIGTIGVNYTIPANTQEIYAECSVDRETGAITLVVDGKVVPGAANPLTGPSLTNMVSKGGNIGILPMVGTVLNAIHTDTYIVYDAKDDGVNSRMGAIDITAVPLEVSSNVGFDVTNIGDVLARKDYGTDTGTRVKGVNGAVQAELKLVKADGYVLPNDTPVLGMCLDTKAVYPAGSPGDLRITQTRGSNSRVSDVVLASVPQPLPNSIFGSSSRNTAEQAAATALNGLEISLKVMDR